VGIATICPNFTRLKSKINDAFSLSGGAVFLIFWGSMKERGLIERACYQMLLKGNEKCKCEYLGSEEVVVAIHPVRVISIISTSIHELQPLSATSAESFLAHLQTSYAA
jgi:hypothetical protein